VLAPSRSMSSRASIRRRRWDWVLRAVIAVLQAHGAPMRARAIHAAAEELVGEPVPWNTVKAALAANVAGPRSRFTRVGPGRYMIRDPA
jgi:hypothetical protein